MQRAHTRVRCAASRCMRAHQLARPYCSRCAHARSSRRYDLACALLIRMRTFPVCFSQTRRCRLSCPLPLRERAHWCCHQLEWVRGSRKIPLTHSMGWQHRAALSRKGRGHNNADRLCGPVLSLQTRTSSFPRRISAPGLCIPCFAHPNRGWAERRETFGCSAEHPWACHISRHARHLARRLASHSASRRA